MKYKFHEPKHIKELKQFINGTYDQHYEHKKGDQTLELMRESGYGLEFLLANVIKYASRHGKKKGQDAREDLFKIAHCAILAVEEYDSQHPFLTQKFVRKHIKYNEETGTAVWRKSLGSVKKGDVVGTLDEDGYRRVKIGKHRIRFSHLVLLHCKGEQPTKEQPLVDHRDGNNQNNRIGNLRLADATQNCCNRGTTPRPRNPELLGLKGVRPLATGKFRTEIQFRGVKYTYGPFDTKEEAHERYKRAATELHGEFANFGGVT